MSKTGWIIVASVAIIGVGLGSFFIGKSIGKKSIENN